MQKINRKIGLVIIMVLMILVVNTSCFAANTVSTRARNTASNNSTENEVTNTTNQVTNKAVENTVTENDDIELAYPSIEKEDTKFGPLTMEQVIGGAAVLLCFVGIILAISLYSRSRADEDDWDENDYINEEPEAERQEPKAMKELKDEAAAKEPKAIQEMEDERKLEEIRKAKEEEKEDIPNKKEELEEKLKEIKPLLDSLKLKLPDCQALKPEHFNRLIELCRQKDRGAGIDDLVLRLQCQAQYSPQNIGHFGLGLKEYVHFTSPIRRYADLLIHRALVNACSFSPAEEEMPSQRAFAETADHLCTAERAAAAAERGLTARYLSLYLKPLTGTEFEVKISGLTNAGIFVRIESLGAEGLIPMRSLPKDYYTLLDAGSCLKGTENKLKFRLGQKLAVVLCEASPESGGLIFRYAGEDPVREEKPARPSKAKKKKTTKTKNKERKKKH